MKKTDILCSSVDCKYSEYTDKLISFVSELQLKDIDLWQLTARQFGEHSDAADYGWRGEFWGKLMRGACGIYEYTHDKEIHVYPLETEIQHMCAFNIQMGDMSINLIDYSSAGKTWDESSELAAWIF